MYSSKVKDKVNDKEKSEDTNAQYSFDNRDQQKMLLNEKSGTSFFNNNSQLGQHQTASFVSKTTQQSNSALGQTQQNVNYSSLDQGFDTRVDAQRGSLPTTYGDRGVYPPLAIPSNQVLQFSDAPNQPSQRKSPTANQPNTKRKNKIEWPIGFNQSYMEKL